MGKAFDTVKKEHPEEDLYIKKDILWKMNIKTTKGVSHKDISAYLWKLELLFGFLMFRPVRRAQTFLLKHSKYSEGKFDKLPLITSLFDLNNQKIAIIKQKPEHHFLQAITLKTLQKNPEIISKWFKENEPYLNFVQRINTPSSVLYEHELKATLILNMVLLEIISIDLKQHKQYDKVIEEYDYNKQTRALLAKTFG